MAKLIIDPGELARVRAAIAEQERAKSSQSLPPRAQAFWDYREADTPAWRLENSAQRENRHQLESLGSWTGG